MGEALLHINIGEDRFRIDYPYYGLFGSAEVTPVRNENDLMFQCRLLNGTVLYLKKLAQSKKWMDLGLNRETPLSAIIGNSIDDFLKKFYK